MATEKNTATESASLETTVDATTTATASGDSNSFTVVLDADKAKAIRSNLGDRTYFESDEKESALAKAEKHLEAAAAKTDSFYGLNIAIGEGLESASRILVSTVGVRDKGDPSKSIPARNGYKAIVVMQQPSVADFLASDSEAARAFVAKLIEREATDVQFAGIRAAETVSDLQTVMAGLQIDVESIVENSRTSGAGDSSFDTMWADFRKGVIKVKFPQVDKLLPSKPEVLKAIKSSAYASANPATKPLEAAGFFAKIGAALVKAGEVWKDDSGVVSPLDTSDIAGWLAERDQTVIDFKIPDVKAEDLAALEF